MVDTIKNLNAYNQLEVINCVVDKNQVNNESGYDVFGNCLKFGLQRIDNNIFFNKSRYQNFLVFMDEGCEVKSRKMTRLLYRYNYVPFEQSDNARQIRLKSLIDDPVHKKSGDCYFIQVADLIAYLVSQYIYIELGIDISNKRRKYYSDEKIREIMEELSPIFNAHASKEDKLGYGIIVLP